LHGHRGSPWATWGAVARQWLQARGSDTVGPALLATLAPDQFQTTLDMQVTFLRPIRPGRVVSRGRVLHRVGDIAFLEASLLDADGEVAATAKATAQVIPLSAARAAA
jgi:acyl-coenzyme A thioesterase PaaI-like protein